MLSSVSVGEGLKTRATPQSDAPKTPNCVNKDARRSTTPRTLVDAAALERSITEFAESSDSETSFVALISRRGAFVAFVRVS